MAKKGFKSSFGKNVSKAEFTRGFDKNSFLGSAFPQTATANSRMVQKRMGVDLKGQSEKMALGNKKRKTFSFKKF